LTVVLLFFQKILKSHDILHLFLLQRVDQPLLLSDPRLGNLKIKVGLLDRLGHWLAVAVELLVQDGYSCLEVTGKAVTV